MQQFWNTVIVSLLNNHTNKEKANTALWTGIKEGYFDINWKYTGKKSKGYSQAEWDSLAEILLYRSPTTKTLRKLVKYGAKFDSNTPFQYSLPVYIGGFKPKTAFEESMSMLVELKKIANPAKVEIKKASPTKIIKTLRIKS